MGRPPPERAEASARSLLARATVYQVGTERRECAPEGEHAAEHAIWGRSTRSAKRRSPVRIGVSGGRARRVGASSSLLPKPHAVQAYTLSPEPRYLWNLSVAEIESKHPADAINHFRVYFRSPEVRAGDLEKAKPILEGATKQTLQLHIVAPTGSRLSIDGVQLKEDAPLPDDVAVMPGKHVVEARLVDRVKTATVDGAAGGRAEVKIEIETTPVPSGTTTAVPSASASSSAVPTASSTAPPPPPPSNTGKFIGAGVLTGVGVLGLVGWGAFAAVANGAESDANAFAGTGACVDRASATCQDLQSKLDRQGTFHAASLASLVVGAVFLAGGIGVFAWALTSKPKQTMGITFSPTVTAGGVGATLQGSF